MRMNRLLILLLAFSPFAAAEPIHLFCEGKETTNQDGPISAPRAQSHSVMLDRIKHTIAVGHVKASYNLTASNDAYLVMDRDVEKNRLNHYIELNRHSLGLDYSYRKGEVLVDFRGKCTLFDPKI
jgi:hypothetical protein